MKKIVTIFLCITLAIKGMHRREYDHKVTPFFDKYVEQELSPIKKGTDMPLRGKLTIFEVGNSSVASVINEIDCPESIKAVANERSHEEHSVISNSHFIILSRFTNLTHLFLDAPDLKSFEGIACLKKLVVLECKESKNLQSVRGLEKLTQLKKLVLLRCNELKTLGELRTYPLMRFLPETLEHLEVSQAQLLSLDCIYHLTALKTLIVKKNRTSLFCAHENDVELLIPDSVEYLNLSSTQLKSMSFLPIFTRCKCIKLNNNRIKELPYKDIMYLVKTGYVERFELSEAGITITQLTDFFINYAKNENSKYNSHPVIRCLKNLLDESITREKEKLKEEKSIIKQKLSKLKEIKRIYSDGFKN